MDRQMNHDAGSELRDYVEISTEKSAHQKKINMGCMRSIQKLGQILWDLFRNYKNLFVLITCVMIIIISKVLVIYETYVMVHENMIIFTNYVEGVDPFLLALAHQWDSYHLVNIAMNGYPSGVTDDIAFAFAPLYPAIVAIVNNVIGDCYISGIWVSNIFYFMSLIAFYYVAKHHMEELPAYLSTTFFAVFPTYLVYGTVAYTESTALFFAITSWYYFERECYHISSILLTLAIITRYVFVMAFPVYGIIMWIRWIKKIDEREPSRFFFDWQLLWLAIPIVTVVIIFKYFELLTGNFFVAVTSHKFFGDTLMTPIDQFNWFFTGFFTNLNEINPIGFVLEHYVFTVPFLVLTLSLLRNKTNLGIYGLSMMLFVLSMVGISGIASPRIMLSSWVTMLAFGDETPVHVYAVAISLCIISGLWVMFSFQTSFFA